MLNVTAMILAAAVAAATDSPPGSGAPPAPPPAVKTATATPAVDPLDQVVCRQMEETGSRLGGARICRTRRDWLQSQRDARRTVEQIQQNGSMTKLPGS